MKKLILSVIVLLVAVGAYSQSYNISGEPDKVVCLTPEQKKELALLDAHIFALERQINIARDDRDKKVASYAPFKTEPHCFARRSVKDGVVLVYISCWSRR